MIDQNDAIQKDIPRGKVLFGNIDSWLIWNLTGGIHVTDVTNASRTMLMNLDTLDWDTEPLEIIEIQRGILPDIRSSSEIYGTANRGMAGIPISGDLGDQQVA